MPIFKVLHMDSNKSETFETDSAFKALILADFHKNKTSILTQAPDLNNKTDEQLKIEYKIHVGSKSIGLNDVAVFLG